MDLKLISIGQLIKDKLVSVQTGPFGTQLKASEYTEEGIPVINVRNIGFGDLREDKVEFVSEMKANKLKNHRLMEGDIVFGRKGAVERHLFVRKEQDGWIQGSDCLRLRVYTEHLSAQFLSYYFRTQGHQDWMNNYCSFGATMTSLNQDIISKIQVPCPSLAHQLKIVETLKSYDELIALNNQRIKLLEETAKEFYKEWFVRMRFPGYKETKFVKGVPEGWEIKELKEFGKIFTGKTPPTKVSDFYGGAIPFIKTPDLHDNFFIYSTEERLTEKGNDSQKRSTLPKGSICVSCIGTGGVVGITTAERSQTNQQINSLIPHSNQLLEFLFFAISNLKETIELYGSTGATMTNLSKGKFERLKILFPKDELVEKYHIQANPIFKQVAVLQEENNHLGQIRDRLLPRLMSGKLKLKTQTEDLVCP